jgi:hypothetical protein
MNIIIVVIIITTMPFTTLLTFITSLLHLIAITLHWIEDNNKRGEGWRTGAESKAKARVVSKLSANNETTNG